MKTHSDAAKDRARTVRVIDQCEGCAYPLAEPVNLAAYDAGMLRVRWYLCPLHR